MHFSRTHTGIPRVTKQKLDSFKFACRGVAKPRGGHAELTSYSLLSRHTPEQHATQPFLLPHFPRLSQFCARVHRTAPTADWSCPENG